MSDESQKPVTDSYREGWERIYGKKPAKKTHCDCDLQTSGMCHDDQCPKAGNPNA